MTTYRYQLTLAVDREGASRHERQVVPVVGEIESEADATAVIDALQDAAEQLLERAGREAAAT